MENNEVGRARRAVRKWEKEKKKEREWKPPGSISDKTRVCTHDYTGMLEIDRGPKIDIQHKDKE